MGVTIRPATPDDLAAMLAIEQSVFAGNAWTEGQLGDELERIGDTRWYAVAETDGDVTGYVGLYLSPPDADVQTLAVAPDQRGSGLGRTLLQAAVAAAWEGGCTRIFLEVRADNEAALQLYESAGFRRLGRRARYYPDGADALTMRLRRSEPAPLGSVAHG